MPGLEQKAYPEYVGKGKFIENLTPNSRYTFEKKYLLRDDDGEVIETPPEAIYRISSTMAQVESQYEKNPQQIEELTKEFYETIAEGNFCPAGRIWTNAGTEIKGLFNCYVLPVGDHLEEIFESVKNAALIHKEGGGTGYNFSEVRPRGTYVKKSKGVASGPVSFIKQFNTETEIINSGNRRGANMGILDVNHPDIFDFIYAKSKRGEITNFNVSVGATDDFMNAVKNNGFYDLCFPEGVPFKYERLAHIIKNVETNKIGGSEVGEKPRSPPLKFVDGEIVLGETEIIDSYTEKVAGRVSEEGTVQLFAPYVMDQISELAWETADPGMIFLDAINRNNPKPKQGLIKATNPCGEQPLPPYDACNLGSIVLSNFVALNADNQPYVDYGNLEKTIYTATRFMDNVNDANKGPIPEVEKTVLAHRRIGLGVMGWADMLVKMNLGYDSPEAKDLAKEVMEYITKKTKEASKELAQEKGVFPEFGNSYYDSDNEEERVRNIQRTTIAPNGTISMVHEVGSGIEPFFSIAYVKKIRGGDELKYINPLFNKMAKERGLDVEELMPLIEKNHGSVQGIDKVPEDLQKIFKSAHDLDYKSHIAVQAAFQEHTDNAVSKTINMRNSATVKDVKDAYLLAWENNLKGVTVYRDGCKDIQVLNAGISSSERRIDRKEIGGLVEKLLHSGRPEGIIGTTIKSKTNVNQDAFVTMNLAVEKEGLIPYEVFFNLGKAGDDFLAIGEGYGRLISAGLQAGIPLNYLANQLKGIGGETKSGFGRLAIKSIPDAIGKALESAPAEIESVLKKLMGDSNKSSVHGKNRKGDEEGSINGGQCVECGGPLFYEEGCQKCSCGYSKC